ncbi:MAG: DUF58 domain-containing protein [Lachnospiraceae bacterium]|nr:DUF58 domain-containing protein [Lachnospiraceae bacterium]
MRRNRIILLLLWILSLIAISFYGGAVSYGFFTVLTLIPVVSFLYLTLVIMQFRIYQRLEGKAIIANRTSDFYFTLQNEGLMAFASIRVLFYSTFSTISGLTDDTAYELLPHTGIRRQTKMVCKYRGEYDVGIKKIVVQDFFRLFTITYHNREPLRIMVKPNVITLPSLKSAEQVLNTARENRMMKREPDAVVREYRPGDDIRFMHWNATAAMQKPMIRERIGEQQQGIAIVLDSSRKETQIEEYLPIENKMLETVLALTLHFSRTNTPATVYCQAGAAGKADTAGITSMTVSEQRQFDAFYEQMSAFAFDPKKAVAALYEGLLASGSLYESRAVFLVTHIWDPATERFVRELSRGQLSVQVYLVADDVPAPGIPRCSLTAIPADADLTEVL